MMLFNPFSKVMVVSVYESVASELSPVDVMSSVEDTSLQVLAQEAAAGQCSAAGQLLHWIIEDDPQVATAITSLDDDRLVQHLLEFIALGSWAGQSFIIPQQLRSPFARMRLSTLILRSAEMDSQRAERVLIAALHDSRSVMRKTAASILGLQRCAAAVPMLIEALHDSVPAVQLQAVKALGCTRNPAGVSALFSLLQDADEQLGNQIFTSLIQLGSVAVPALIENSTSSLPWIRWQCMRALGNINDSRALPMLVHTLADVNQSVAWMAAKGLVPFGRLSVGPVLRLLMSAVVTPWLIETASYVLRNQRDPRLQPYLEPLIEHMHGVSFRIGTLLSAQKTLSQLITDGLLESDSQEFWWMRQQKRGNRF